MDKFIDTLLMLIHHVGSVMTAVATTSLVSSVGASLVASLLVTKVTTVFSSWIERRKNLVRTQEAHFTQVLGCDDMATLGNYLDDTLGGVSVSDYVTDQRLAERIDRYLKKIQGYVGTTQAMSDQKSIALDRAALSTPPNSTIVPVPESVSATTRSIESELLDGEVWNALAKLRRQIEIAIRATAVSNGIPTYEASKSIVGRRVYENTRALPLFRVVKLLSRQGLLDDTLSYQLELCLFVCNRAVHGLDVPADEAELALEHGRSVLSKMNQLGKPSVDPKAP